MDKLLKEVKAYNHITWDEEDEAINKIILEGKQYLSEKIDTDINFEKDLVALGLLKDYVRYVRNYSAEYFEQNFLNKIVSLQLKYAANESDLNVEETENEA